MNLPRAGWVRASLLSVGIFALVVATGEALAAIQLHAFSLPGFDVARAGFLYVFAFHHVGIDVSVVDLHFRGVPFSLGHALSYGFSISLLLVTFGAGALLFVAGRRIAASEGGSFGRRVVHGMTVAPAYALCSFLLSYAASFSIAAPGGEVSGRIDVGVSHAGALVVPLLIAAVAGALGGAWSAGGEHRSWGLDAVRGGVRMFLAGLVLSLVGLLVVAALKPDATRRYFDATLGGGLKGTDGFVHTVLAAPNLATWTLVPASGGCDSVRGQALGSGVRNVDFLCYGSFPGNGGFGTAPAPWFLFLLVPMGAVAYGVAGRRITVPIAAAGGIVFAALVGFDSWLSGIDVTASGARAHAHAAIGPRPVWAFAATLGWGGVGGMLVAAFTASRGVLDGSRAVIGGVSAVRDHDDDDQQR